MVSFHSMALQHLLMSSFLEEKHLLPSATGIGQQRDEELLSPGKTHAHLQSRWKPLSCGLFVTLMLSIAINARMLLVPLDKAQSDSFCSRHIEQYGMRSQLLA